MSKNYKWHIIPPLLWSITWSLQRSASKPWLSINGCLNLNASLLHNARSPGAVLGHRKHGSSQAQAPCKQRVLPWRLDTMCLVCWTPVCVYTPLYHFQSTWSPWIKTLFFLTLKLFFFFFFLTTRLRGSNLWQICVNDLHNTGRSLANLDLFSCRHNLFPQ